VRRRDFLAGYQSLAELRGKKIGVLEQVLRIFPTRFRRSRLADRVYVLTPRPARIAASIPMEAPRAREIDDPYVIATQRSVLRALGVE
jgi:hypothetical protein